MSLSACLTSRGGGGGGREGAVQWYVLSLYYLCDLP